MKRYLGQGEAGKAQALQDIAEVRASALARGERLVRDEPLAVRNDGISPDRGLLAMSAYSKQVAGRDLWYLTDYA